ncbi:MAG: DUF4278 domain-containing protein [Pleurocapsa sp. MO_192.B19]|nr:DUF4278 domain-containing protein [Pleurocapsa sp. MO_192.B19]
MKLRYRGIEYDYNPPAVSLAEGEVGGKYRGLDWRFHNLNKPLLVQPRLNLTYRGVKYSNQPVSTPTERPKTTSIAERARRLAIKREKANRNRQASLLHRTSEEIGLV